jgi:hypothetical protein
MTIEQLIEYMKIHLISLSQDQDKLTKTMTNLDENSKQYKDLDFEYNWLSGQLVGIHHILEVAERKI